MSYLHHGESGITAKQSALYFSEPKHAGSTRIIGVVQYTVIIICISRTGDCPVRRCLARRPCVATFWRALFIAARG